MIKSTIQLNILIHKKLVITKNSENFQGNWNIGWYSIVELEFSVFGIYNKDDFDEDIKTNTAL